MPIDTAFTTTRGKRVLLIVTFLLGGALLVSLFPVYRDGYSKIKEHISFPSAKVETAKPATSAKEEVSIDIPAPSTPPSWSDEYLTKQAAAFRLGSSTDLNCDQKNLEYPQRATIVKSGIDTHYKMYLHKPGVDIHISEQLWNKGNLNGWFFETPFQKMYSDHLKLILGDKKGIVLDIGANIGTHAMFFASLGHKVLAFEPFETNFRLLQCSTWLNEYSNMFLFPAGLASEVSDGDKCVVTPDGTNAGHTVVTSSCADSKNKIRTLTVDQVWEKVLNKQQVDYIKIDIEGYEPIALAGAHNMLTTAPPPIITGEFTPYSSVAAGVEKPEEYIYRMMGYGYKVYENGKEWDRAKTATRVEELLKANGLTDLVFVHQSFNSGAFPASG